MTAEVPEFKDVLLIARSNSLVVQRKLSNRDSVLVSLDALIISKNTEETVPQIRLRELRERLVKLDTSEKELKRSLEELKKEVSDLNNEIKEQQQSKKNDLDKIQSIENKLRQAVNELTDCQRIHSSLELQQEAVNKQIDILEKGGRSELERKFQRPSQIARTVLAVSDDGFPAIPPKGTLYIHYDDGFIEAVQECTPLDKAKLEERYGFEPKGYYAKKLHELERAQTRQQRMSSVPLDESGRRGDRRCVVS
mmetsp:Transcript_2774/g.5121  ORF Transcript_2774/g.5121 Transcript_2774/m.5121 type:complete len:252 (-) Transcript_2774:130-885(-)